MAKVKIREASPQDIEAHFKEGYLVIKIRLDSNPGRSQGGKGKNIVLVSTRGNVYPIGLRHEGKPVIVGVNAFVSADDSGDPTLGSVDDDSAVGHDPDQPKHNQMIDEGSPVVSQNHNVGEC